MRTSEGLYLFEVLFKHFFKKCRVLFIFYFPNGMFRASGGPLYSMGSPGLRKPQTPPSSGKQSPPPASPFRHFKIIAKWLSFLQIWLLFFSPLNSECSVPWTYSTFFLCLKRNLLMVSQWVRSLIKHNPHSILQKVSNFQIRKY